MSERLGPFYGGEAAVISSCVHIINRQRAGEVGVLVTTDAGRTFYHRHQRHEIAHIDVFHQWGAVSPHSIAHALRTAAKCVFLDLGLTDIQTGAGGGCASGSLKYGQKESLRKVHMNHVHIAMLRLHSDVDEWGEADILNRHVVHFVEGAILEAGLGLCRVDKITALLSAGDKGNKGAVDLSPYSDDSDSHLGTLPATAKPGALGPGALSAQAIQWAADRQRTTLPELREMLKKVKDSDPTPITKSAYRPLIEEGIVNFDLRTEVNLTEKGEAILHLLQHRMPELEAELISSARQAARRSGFSLRRVEATHGAHRTRCMPREEAPAVASLAVAETVTTTIQRAGRLRITSPDIRMQARRRPPRADVLFLIDGSASMEGSRIQAARGVIRAVAASGRGRCGAIVFQERRGDVVVPMTRAISTVLDCASHLQPSGLTPLAAGLQATRHYFHRARSRHCVLVVITDGIPTVSQTGNSPLDEAIDEAKILAQMMPHGLLVGIDANTHYLMSMAQATGWRVLLLNDLEQDAILQEIGKVFVQAMR